MGGGSGGVREYVYGKRKFEVVASMTCKNFVFGNFIFVPNVHTPATTPPPIVAACLKCGAIEKTGKLSCCARGGSWFGNCGGADNAKREHTWHEGLQACTSRQSKVAIGQQQKNENDEQQDMNSVEMSQGQSKAVMEHQPGQQQHTNRSDHVDTVINSNKATLVTVSASSPLSSVSPPTLSITTPKGSTTPIVNSTNVKSYRGSVRHTSIDMSASSPAIQLYHHPIDQSPSATYQSEHQSQCQ